MFESLPKGASVGILLQRVPDPDAIGSFAGLSWLLKQTKNASCFAYHKGKVSHPQTKAMLNILGIQLAELPESDAIPPEQHFVIADSTPEGTGFKCPYQYVVDHHKAEYPDGVKVLNKPVGAACSLVFELIHEADLDLDDPVVATAMMIGLYTDTDGLRGPGTTELDHEAYRYLSERTDRAKAKQIFNYPIPLYQFELEARAIQEREVKESKLVTCLGEISASQRDTMPVVADHLLRLQGIDTVVVFAIIENHIDASIRSTDSTLDVDAFCKDAFGEQFHGSAGSKQGGIGGGRAPLGIAVTKDDPEEERAEALESLERRLKSRLLRKLTD